MMKRRVISVLLIFIMISAIFPINTSSDEIIEPLDENYTEFEFIPPSDYLYFNHTQSIDVSLYINVQTNQSIDTVGTDLITFSPDILQCTDIVWGNLFEDDLIRINGNINNTAGTIKNMIWGSTISTTDSGYYANFTFDVIGKGYGYIRISSDPSKTGVALGGSPLPWRIISNYSITSSAILISNEYPENHSINMPHNLLLSIDLNHSLGESMGIYWKSNATGAWKTIGIDNSLPNGTYDMSCYGVVESPYDQHLNYTCIDYYSSRFHANTCPGRDLGAITKVEIYTPGYSGTITPVFGSRVGETYTVPTSKYTNITFDDSAPTQWQWDDIVNLDIDKSSSSPTYIHLTYDLGFGDDVLIFWSVNVSDGEMWRNETYWYYTELQTPIISNPSPYDSETWLTYYPTLSVDVEDPNGDTMNVSFYYLNDTDDWEQIGSSQFNGNGTYSQPTTLAEYNKTIYWRVVVTDDENHTKEIMYRFTFREVQPPPIDFIATTVCDEAINLSWTAPPYTDNIRIQRRPDRFPSSISDGLNIFNGTGTSALDDAVDPGTSYYYSAWSWNNTDKTWSIENSSATEITAPSEVTGFTVTTTGHNSTHLNWTKGVGAESTLIRRKIGSYPVNQSDGVLVYEGNATSWDDIGLGGNITYYYRAWAHYLSGIYIPMYQNPDPSTGVDVIYAEGGSHRTAYEYFTITPGQSFKATSMVLPLWTSRMNYVYATVALYHGSTLLYGKGYPDYTSNWYFPPGGWDTFTFPSEIYMKAGETYYIQVHAGVTTHQVGTPNIKWGINETNPIYYHQFQIYGYYGYYSCEYAEANTTTDVGPPLVTTLPADNIEDYNATLHGYLDADGGEATTVGFLWENSTGPQNTTIGLKVMDSLFELNISGLEQATTYTFNTWASNAYGYAYGTQQFLITRPQEPDNITTTLVTNDHINLTWTKGEGADITSVRMKIGSYPADTTDGLNAGWTTENWTAVSDLSGNTTYFFRAWSYNTTNGLYSSLSDGIFTTTLVGPPNISSLPVSSIQDTTAYLNSILVYDGGESSECGFRWGSSPGTYTHNQTTGNFTTGQTQILPLSSLTIGTMYYYQSWARNLGGFSADAEERFATRPVAPISFNAENYGALRVNLTWTKGDGEDQTRIQRKLGSYPTSVTDGTNIYNGTGSLYQDVSLTENTTYYYRAWSFNNTNNLYSTLYSSDTDITDWLPNITISPCSELNMDRPVTLSITGEDDNPLIYRFYNMIGQDNRLLGYDAVGDWSMDAWAAWIGWDPAYIDNALEYGLDAHCIAGSWKGNVGTTALYIYYEKPILATGVDMSYVSYLPTSGVEKTGIYYHDYLNNTWYYEEEIGWLSHIDFDRGATVVDAVGFAIGDYGFDYYSWRDYYDVYCDYVGATRPPYEVYSVSASSLEEKTHVYDDVIPYICRPFEEGYTHHWMGSVENNIDQVNMSCWFETEGMLFSEPSPYEGEMVYNDAYHNCSIKINHTGGDIMDLYFYYYNYTSLSYSLGGENADVGNGTYQWVYPDSDELSTIYTWKVCAWDHLDWHNETYTFNVRSPFTPNPPSFTLSNNRTRGVNLTGIAGDGSTTSIMIRYKTVEYPTSITDGSLVFNGTYSSYEHTGLDPNTRYYYRAWAYNNTDGLWSSPTSHDIITLGPQPPTFNTAKENSTVIHLTDISRNAYSTTVLIRAKIGSYPSDRNDGLFVCNTTGSTFDHTGLTPASNYYYRAWAYDEPDHWWSQPTDHTQRTNGPISFSSPYPHNIKLEGVNPILQVTLDDYNDEDDIYYYFRSNYSGAWTTIHSGHETEGLKQYYSTEFYQQDWDYWWSMNATDGEYWTNASYTFETGSMAVPNVTATTMNTSVVHLNWTKAPGTTHTYIERKIDDYPASRTDGVNIYFGTGESADDTGISPGELCRYKIWSYNSSLGVYSSGNKTIQALTKPYGPNNFTSAKVDYQTINLTWVKGDGSQKTVIVYKPDEYPDNRSDGTLVYNNVGVSCNVTGLMPDDFLNYFTPLPGTDNFGVYIGGGDPFNNSCDKNELTKWDLNRTKTGNFSYILGIEPQRVKGFSILFKDFYREPGADWEAAITKFEVYNGTWTTDWEGEIYNTGSEKEWYVYQTDEVYKNVSEVRFSAWTEYITPDLYEVKVGKLGYVHCFKSWGYVTKGGLEQYSDDYDMTENETEDTPPNIVPYITLNSPGNGTSGWNRNPLLNITIADQEGQQMNISWQYLYNGSWIQMHQTTLVSNGTYTYTPSVFTELTTTYYWRVNVSDTADVQYSAVYTNYNISPTWDFITRDAYIPNPPNDFDATEYGAHKINMTWTLGTYADRTYIERNTTASWSRGQGILRFNSTGLFFQDTGLNDNTTYYYQAWGYNSSDHTWSITYSSDNAKTEFSSNDPPNQPFNPAPTNNTDYMNVYNIWLNCTVTDPNEDTMDVHFYWGNDTYIGTVTGVTNGSTAQLFLPTYWHRMILGYECTWVTHDITHIWYAVADDSEYNTSSATWNFHTNKAWDLDCNKRCNYLDLSTLVSHYGQRVYPPGAFSWDIDENTYANYLDLSTLVSHYGQIY